MLETAGKLSEAGIVAILLFLLLTLLGSIILTMRLLYKRLLEGENGLLVQLTKKHIEFLDNLNTSIESMNATITDNVKVARKMESSVRRLQISLSMSNVNIASFGKLWRYHTSFLRKMAIAGGFEEDVREDLDSIEKLLNDTDWNSPNEVQ